MEEVGQYHDGSLSCQSITNPRAAPSKELGPSINQAEVESSIEKSGLDAQGWRYATNDGRLFDLVGHSRCLSFLFSLTFANWAVSMSLSNYTSPMVLHMALENLRTRPNGVTRMMCVD